MIRTVRSALFACVLVACFVIYPAIAIACVEGLAWGMPQSEINDHLNGAIRQEGINHQRLIARNIHLDQLPVPKLTLDMNEQGGLQSLAYEFSMDDMTEVLAGLSARHGKPISTSIKENNYEDQLWVWNTGEDLITAVKRTSGDAQKFLIAYRPSRLKPEIL
jgi:hypothetical protein